MIGPSDYWTEKSFAMAPVSDPPAFEQNDGGSDWSGESFFMPILPIFAPIIVSKAIEVDVRCFSLLSCPLLFLLRLETQGFFSRYPRGYFRY